MAAQLRLPKAMADSEKVTALRAWGHCCGESHEWGGCCCVGAKPPPNTHAVKERETRLHLPSSCAARGASPAFSRMPSGRSHSAHRVCEVQSGLQLQRAAPRQHLRVAGIRG